MNSETLVAEEREGILYIRTTLSNYADADINVRFREGLESAIDGAESDLVVLSLSGVNRLTSETIGALLRARERVQARKGQLALCEVAKDVREVLKLLSLDGSVLSVCDSISEAKALLVSPS